MQSKDVATAVPTPGSPRKLTFSIHAFDISPRIMMVQSPPTHNHDMSTLRASKSEIRIMVIPTPLLEPLIEAMLNVGKQIRGPFRMLPPRRNPPHPQLERLKSQHAFSMLSIEFSGNVLPQTEHGLRERNRIFLRKHGQAHKA